MRRKGRTNICEKNIFINFQNKYPNLHIFGIGTLFFIFCSFQFLHICVFAYLCICIFEYLHLLQNCYFISQFQAFRQNHQSMLWGRRMCINLVIKNFVSNFPNIAFEICKTKLPILNKLSPPNTQTQI